MVGLHVEATTRCTLACPRCERTTFMERFGKKNFKIQDLDINAFKNFVDIPLDEITFCGNLGDAIYHSNFLELVKISKQKAASIHISTNGSRKSKIWWVELVSLLDGNDKVTFSIDGTPENFNTYRINGDWASIKTGIDVIADSNVISTWKYIPFKFNENDIDYTRKLSEQLGFDHFDVQPSDRWLNQDPLQPSNNFIGNRYALQQEYKMYHNKKVHIDPKCSTNQEHFISAQGYYAPCCYSKHYEFWYKSEWYKNKMTIKNNKLSECIKRFEDFYATLQDSKPDYCLFNCGKC